MSGHPAQRADQRPAPKRADQHPVQKAEGRLAQRADAREGEIAGVAALALAGTGFAGRLLLAGDPTGTLAPLLREKGTEVREWNRHAYTGLSPGTVQPWPPEERFDGAVIRLPRGWTAFAMTLNAVASRLAEGAPLWVYGGNDEGIATAPKRLDGLFGDADTLLIKRRTRVLAMARTAAPARGGLEDWRETVEVTGDCLSGPLTLASYPGLFAHGRLDPGTACLLTALPPVKAGARVLDFGCGAGVIAAEVHRRSPEAVLTVLDVDALALHAVERNVPGAERVLSDGWAALPAGARFDLILSNPPLHRGKEEDFSAVDALVRDASARLRPNGALLAVVQRTAGAGRLLRTHFPLAECLMETPQYQVWLARAGR